jgi:hypothetical protein
MLSTSGSVRLSRPLKTKRNLKAWTPPLHLSPLYDPSATPSNAFRYPAARRAAATACSSQRGGGGTRKGIETLTQPAQAAPAPRKVRFNVGEC